MSMLRTNQPPPPDHIVQTALHVWGQAGGEHFIPITGCSMLPLIQDGDQVLVSHGCAGVQPGDVVLFQQKGTLVAHRVMRIQYSEAGQVFITKGDNGLHFDPSVNADEIVGRVLAVKRGHRVMSLDTPFWRIVGWLVAVVTWPVAGLYAWGRGLKRGFWGAEPSRLTTFLRQSALAIFSFILKVVQGVAGRWEK
jgi:signal peptidase I